MKRGKKASSVQIEAKLWDGPLNLEFLDLSKPVPDTGNPNHARVQGVSDGN